MRINCAHTVLYSLKGMSTSLKIAGFAPRNEHEGHQDFVLVINFSGSRPRRPRHRR